MRQDRATVQAFTDRGGGKDTQRPQLKAALEYLLDGDTLIIHSMDRLARNAEDLVRIVREPTGRGVAVQFVKYNLTFSGKADPMAKLMLTLLAAVAEFERDLIRERQREGIATAKAKGVYRGRNKALAKEQLQELVELARNGMPKAELARSDTESRSPTGASYRASGLIA